MAVVVRGCCVGGYEVSCLRLMPNAKGPRSHSSGALEARGDRWLLEYCNVSVGGRSVADQMSSMVCAAVMELSGESSQGVASLRVTTWTKLATRATGPPLPAYHHHRDIGFEENSHSIINVIKLQFSNCRQLSKAITRKIAAAQSLSRDMDS